MRHSPTQTKVLAEYEQNLQSEMHGFNYETSRNFFARVKRDTWVTLRVIAVWKKYNMKRLAVSSHTGVTYSPTWPVSGSPCTNYALLLVTAHLLQLVPGSGTLSLAMLLLQHRCCHFVEN